MQLLQIVNEVLRKRRERPVASIATNPYGSLLVDFITEVCRELAVVGDLDGGTLTINGVTSVFGTMSMPVPKDVVLGVRAIYATVGLGEELIQISPKQMRTLLSEERGPTGVPPQRPGTKATHFARQTANTLTGDTAYLLSVWPTPPDIPFSPSFRVHLVVNPMRQAVVSDTLEINFPAHLVILGTYWKVLQEVYGEENGDVKAAQAAYLAAVSSEVSMDMQLEGSGVDAWTPV